MRKAEIEPYTFNGNFVVVFREDIEWGKPGNYVMMADSTSLFDTKEAAEEAIWAYGGGQYA